MISERLRVHVVIQAGTAGGAEQVLLGFLDEEASRLELTFDMLANGPLVDEIWRFGPVSVVPTGSSPLALARTARVLAARWRTLDADVVLVNGVKAAVVGIPAARLAGFRAVWFKHDFSYDHLLAPALARGADAVVATSAEVAAATLRRDTVVVSPPRPPDPLPRSRARRTLESRGLPTTDRLVVAVVGRLASYKGVDDVITALALPAAEQWHLVVVGADDPSEPGERERLERLAVGRGVADRVTFLGRIERAGQLLSGVDAVAVVTRTDGRGFGREGFGIVAAEAMLAGVPLIATPGPPAERLDGAGIVVPPGSPQQLSDALARLSDARLRKTMGRRGRTIVSADPDRSERAAELVASLAAAAGRPGAGLASSVPISIVTTVLDEAASVDDLLGLVVPQLGDDDEIVVVDGGSRDDTRERLAAWSERDGRVRWLEAQGATIAAGRNEGIRAARHDAIACIDAGCAPWEGWLDALRAAFAERLSLDLVTGVYEAAARTTFEHAMAAACYPSVAEARRPGPLARLYGATFGTAFAPEMPTGRSVGFTRSAWERVGGFSEGLDTAEDVTFGRAIAEGGRCALALDAGVLWRQRSSLGATAEMYYRYGGGGVRARDLRLVGRDAVRAGAYALAPFALARSNGRTRSLMAAGAIAYLSLPLVRARRRPRSTAVALLVPAALVVKDVSKAAGMIATAFRAFAGRGRPTRIDNAAERS
jgi:glycosyltransferase involved in cell wall biosynthesis/GT2 family glycosyltransferase